PGNVVVDGTDSVVEKTLAGVDVPRVDQRDRLDDPMLGRSDRQNVALYQLLKKPSIRVGTLALAFGDPPQASGQAGQVVLINHLLPQIDSAPDCTITSVDAVRFESMGTSPLRPRPASAVEGNRHRERAARLSSVAPSHCCPSERPGGTR